MGKYLSALKVQVTLKSFINAGTEKLICMITRYNDLFY